MIRFNNSRRSQAEESIRDKNAMADIANISSEADNYLPYKNNIEYEWVKFIQTNKMTKRLMTIFFGNPTLVPIEKDLSYKNMDKIKALLTKLLYDKVTW